MVQNSLVNNNQVQYNINKNKIDTLLIGWWIHVCVCQIYVISCSHGVKGFDMYNKYWSAFIPNIFYIY